MVRVGLKLKGRSKNVDTSNDAMIARAIAAADQGIIDVYGNDGEDRYRPHSDQLIANADSLLLQPSQTKKKKKKSFLTNKSTTTNTHHESPPSQQPSQQYMCLVPCIVGKTGGFCVELMVDSGASSSVISLGLAKRLNLTGKMNVRNGTAYGVGETKIVGDLSNVPCKLGNVEFSIDFLVLGDSLNNSELLLLGLDQMRKYKCIIDLERNIMLFGGMGGVEVPMLPPG